MILVRVLYSMLCFALVMAKKPVTKHQCFPLAAGSSIEVSTNRPHSVLIFYLDEAKFTNIPVPLIPFGSFDAYYAVDFVRSMLWIPGLIHHVNPQDVQIFRTCGPEEIEGHVCDDDGVWVIRMEVDLNQPSFNQLVDAEEKFDIDFDPGVWCIYYEEFGESEVENPHFHIKITQPFGHANAWEFFKLEFLKWNVMLNAFLMIIVFLKWRLKDHEIYMLLRQSVILMVAYQSSRYIHLYLLNEGSYGRLSFLLQVILNCALYYKAYKVSTYSTHRYEKFQFPLFMILVVLKNIFVPVQLLLEVALWYLLSESIRVQLKTESKIPSILQKSYQSFPNLFKYIFISLYGLKMVAEVFSPLKILFTYEHGYKTYFEKFCIVLAEQEADYLFSGTVSRIVVLYDEWWFTAVLLGLMTLW